MPTFFLGQAHDHPPNRFSIVANDRRQGHGGHVFPSRTQLVQLGCRQSKPQLWAIFSGSQPSSRCS